MGMKGRKKGIKKKKVKNERRKRCKREREGYILA